VRGKNPETGRWQRPLFLFGISFLCLFLELLLIRWLGTEIRVFAYFRNLILICCFLGLGIGFSLKRFQTGLLTSIMLTALLSLLVHPRADFHGLSLRNIPQYLSFPEWQVWGLPEQTTLLKLAGGFAIIGLVMILLAGIFIPFGQILGRIFKASDNRLRDYSLNLLGSLFGTWIFALLCFLNTPPWLWFLVAGAGLALGIRPWSWRAGAGWAGVVFILLLTFPREPPGTRTFWSPYQKLTFKNELAEVTPGVDVPYMSLEVNSVLYMFLLDLSYGQAEKFPGIFKREDAPYYPYDLPFRFQPRPERVLILGAGAGNDAAGALRSGASEIDAVEIDPIIARLGRTYHPERPYQNPQVRLLIDDARSFLKKSNGQYDLIIFGLLDSHTLTSNFTNINLDSYVYTLESIQEAKAHLAEGGIIALCFQTSKSWLGYKLYAMLEQVFGRPPLVLDNHSGSRIQGAGGTLFLAGDLDRARERIQEDPRLLKKIYQQGISPAEYARQVKEARFDVPEDDWPYLYLQKRQVPTLHLLMTIIIIALMLLAVYFLFPDRKIGPSHFLFLGAGFMLVEVHSISKAALLFGSTWLVNAVIISAVLVMVIAANLVALNYRIQRLHWWYGGLFLSLALAYLLPVHSLLFGGYLARGIFSGAFYSLPLFFAGVVFASSLKRVAGIDAAFASNMLGAAIGGMLESVSFIFGLKMVVLLAMALYVASALALRRMPKSAI